MEYKAAFIHHRNQERIAVWFDNQPDLIARLKKLSDARWSATKNYGIYLILQKIG